MDTAGDFEGGVESEEDREGDDSKISDRNISGDRCFYDDLEDGVLRAFQSTNTPLLFDSSSEEIVCTFYSYQTDVILLDAKAMIMRMQNESLEIAMEIARRCLVNAMKFGKTLVIRMGTSAPDFRQTFNDENLRRVHPQIDENISYFPKELFIGGGQLIRENGDYWAYKLFRDADMYPHRNVAYCRDEFRVMLVSQFHEEEADEYLFGEEWGGLPNRDFFYFLTLLPSSPSPVEKGA